MSSRRPGKKRVEFYYDEEDYAKVVKKAEQCYMKVTPYIRKMSLEGSVVVYDLKSINELIFEINKIGVNINQIAKKVNEFETIHKKDIVKIQQEFDELCLMLNQFLLDLQSIKA